MSKAEILEPFIKEQEGGLSRNTNDVASKNPCPFPYNNLTGWHTNKGITWSLWVKIYGDTEASAKRFFVMDDADWLSVYIPVFWNKMCGDKISSQRIANVIGDWIWTSGQFNPEKDTQEVLNTIGQKHIATDGCFGEQTIDLMNSENENELYTDLINRRVQYVNDIVKNNPSQEVFKEGWLNRINNLAKFNLKFS